MPSSALLAAPQHCLHPHTLCHLSQPQRPRVVDQRWSSFAGISLHQSAHVQRISRHQSGAARWTATWQTDNGGQVSDGALRKAPRRKDGGGGGGLSLAHVVKKYGDRAVLDGVSLHLAGGEVVGLLGPNGAGKSTAFGILVGRDWSTQGDVLLDDEDITGTPLEARARLGIGYLPQEASIFRGLTVADNIRLVLQETGVPPEEHTERLEELLKEFQLEHVAGTVGRSLSGGERRRAELARALAARCNGGPPRILLVDEPFAGVDPIGVQEIQVLLRRLCDENNMGIFITDHNVDETLQICDRAYMLYDGKVMASGTPEELYQNDFVRRYYLGERYVRWPNGNFESRGTDVSEAR